MTKRQRKFCDEYLVHCNATQAAIQAGYSPKTAYSTGQRLLKNVEVKTYISQQMESLHSAKTADAQEVLEYLAAVLRGESKSAVLSLCGEGCQEVIEKPPDEKERLKAAELLGKRYGLFEPQGNGGGAAVAEFLKAVRPSPEAVAALFQGEGDGDAETS